MKPPIKLWESKGLLLSADAGADWQQKHGDWHYWQPDGGRVVMTCIAGDEWVRGYVPPPKPHAIVSHEVVSGRIYGAETPEQEARARRAEDAVKSPVQPINPPTAVVSRRPPPLTNGWTLDRDTETSVRGLSWTDGTKTYTVRGETDGRTLLHDPTAVIGERPGAQSGVRLPWDNALDGALGLGDALVWVRRGQRYHASDEGPFNTARIVVLDGVGAMLRAEDALADHDARVEEIKTDQNPSREDRRWFSRAEKRRPTLVEKVAETNAAIGSEGAVWAEVDEDPPIPVVCVLMPPRAAIKAGLWLIDSRAVAAPGVGARALVVRL